MYKSKEFHQSDLSYLSALASQTDLSTYSSSTIPAILSNKPEYVTNVERAVKALQDGKGAILVDSEDRENEGDIIFPAQSITIAQMAMLIRECSGIVCLCLTEEKLLELELPQMVNTNTSKNKTAFSISIEAVEGVTTGVSAADRVTTIHRAVGENCRPKDLARPGHVFPLCANSGGVLKRPGHTEGTVDLMKLAGFKPAGVLCELMNIDGTMARMPEIETFAKENEFVIIKIEDIVSYLNEKTVQNLNK